MEILCSVDGEVLSRFMDGELPPSEFLRIEAHVSTCADCEIRLTQYRVADVLLSRARGAKAPSAKVVAALSVAAALAVSLATNALLTPRASAAPPPVPLKLSSPPSETLNSFYETVAPAAASTH